MRETGIGIHDPLFFIGVVENNVDERLEGRIQVRAFGVHGTNMQVPTEDLPWATLIHGSYDPNAPLPPVNSFVFGFFIDGRDAQQPMILGLIPTQMTEIIDPEVSGWGRIVERNARILSRGRNPTDIGEPANSRLVRGEDIDGTYVAQQAMSRAEGIPIASADPDDEEGRRAFAEPSPAYNSEYPFNRVIQTACHSIELDDTPGGERITIYSSSGSYIAIDSRGTTVHKSVSDSYSINDRNHNIYIKGDYNITVDGDCRFLVQGNKIEEITGDLIQNVRGNHHLSVGGQSTINASEEVQVRGAKLRLHGNVEGVNINAAKKIRLLSGEMMSLKSAMEMRLESADILGIKSGVAINASADGAININALAGNLNMQSSDDVNLLGTAVYVNADGSLDLKGEHVKAGGGSQVSIDAAIVAIDDVIQLSNGEAVAPDVAGAAGEAEAAEDAEEVEAPEPVGKGVSTTRRQPDGSGSFGHSGYMSRDEPESDGGGGSQTTVAPDVLSVDGAPNFDIRDPEVQERLDELRNDPEFMREFNATLERFPNLTEEELWGTIAGESGGDPTLIAAANGLFGGLFQLGQVSVGLDPNTVAALSPAEQMRLYRGYLETNNYRGGGLGMYQAAPGVVQNYTNRNSGQVPPDNVLLYIPSQYTDAQVRSLQEAGYITEYASRQFGDVVLAQNSAGSRTTITPGTGWVEATPQLRDQGIPGVISVGQVNRFYRER